MPDIERPFPVVPHGHTAPIGRYSPAIAVPLADGRRLLFISGQVPGSPTGEVASTTAQAQAEEVFERLGDVLVAAGGGIGDLVSLTIYLLDMADFPAVSAVRNRVLGDPPPSSTLVQVASLAVAEHRVEISGVAVVPASA
jgi:2-iminobutanoate/2-iminopropanoate deaminase